MHEKTQGHKRPEVALLHCPKLMVDPLIKNEVKTQDQEDVQTQKTVPLNNVNVEPQEPNDKPDLKNIKVEIKTEPEFAQGLLQSVTKGKGKGKGQSNFKKGKIPGQKHMSEDKPEEIKQEPRWKEENKNGH